MLQQSGGKERIGLELGQCLKQGRCSKHEPEQNHGPNRDPYLHFFDEQFEHLPNLRSDKLIQR